MNWIKSRLNKDNFWNLMFWLGVCFSVFLSEQIADFSGIGGLFSLVLSLTLVPYTITRFNQIKHTDNKIFLNSQDENLTNRLPKRLGIVFLVNIFFTAACISKNFNELTISSIIAIALGLPVLYFIYKNCPISILFNKNAWKQEVIGMRGGAYTANIHSSASLHTNSYSSISHSNPIRSPDTINDPSYRYLSSNIYNPDR